MSGKDQLMVHHIVWGVAQVVECTARVQVARHALRVCNLLAHVKKRVEGHRVPASMAARKTMRCRWADGSCAACMEQRQVC
jgi:hypothetical protein